NHSTIPKLTQRPDFPYEGVVGGVASTTAARISGPMPYEPNDQYTNSALRVGDADTYPQRLVGEFIGLVVSNEWVNKEYKLIILKLHEYALRAYAGQMFHLLCPSPDGAEVWMRRPMSIYRVDKAAGHVEFLYKIEGRGTLGIGMLKPGDEFNIAG